MGMLAKWFPVVVPKAMDGVRVQVESKFKDLTE